MAALGVAGRRVLPDMVNRIAESPTMTGVAANERPGADAGEPTSSLPAQSRTWRDWRLLAVLGTVFVLLGLYSGIATFVSVYPFDTATLTVVSVRATGTTVQLNAITGRGERVSVEPAGDVAGDYRVGSSIDAFVMRSGDYVEDSGHWNLTGPLVMIVAGSIFLCVATVKRRWRHPDRTKSVEA